LKQHQEGSAEERIRYLEQRKHAKIQWELAPKQNNVDNLQNVRREGSRHFRNKKEAYLKDKIDELETDSKIKYIRDLFSGINCFNKGYQPRTSIVWDENGALVENSTVFWLDGGTISLSSSMFMALVMLSRQKYKQQNH